VKKKIRRKKMTVPLNNEWQWDTVKLELTNPKGETVTLESGDLSDAFMEECFIELQNYVDKKGGELK
jgi:hypothetical protein